MSPSLEEVVYDLARAALDEQREVVAGLRSRAAPVLAGAGALAALLARPATDNGLSFAQHPAHAVLVCVGIVGAVGALVGAILVLATRDFGFSVDAEQLYDAAFTDREHDPVFHRLEHRIRAHVLICWLGLLLTRIAERQSGHTWRRIALELQRLHQVTLTGPTGPSSRPPRSRPWPRRSSAPPRSKRRRRSPRSLRPNRPIAPPSAPRAPLARVGTRPHPPKPPKTQAPPEDSGRPLTYQLRNPGESDNCPSCTEAALT